MALEQSGRVPGEDYVLLRISTYQEHILEESDRQEPSISRASRCTQGSRVEWTRRPWRTRGIAEAPIF